MNSKYDSFDVAIVKCRLTNRVYSQFAQNAYISDNHKMISSVFGGRLRITGWNSNLELYDIVLVHITMIP